MKIRAIAVSVSALFATSAFAANEQSGSLQVIGHAPLNQPHRFAPSPEVVDNTAFYSNVTTFSGQALANGGAAADPAVPANTITRLLCDDTTYNAATGRSLSGIRFAVANLNAATVSVRARIRFYTDAAGAPGAYITGATFNAFAFATGVTTLNGTLATFAFPGTGSAVKIWSCVTFDNNSAATGATTADLNNFGLGLFNPVDRGSSVDSYFVTTGNGSFVSANPPGATATLAGVVSNFGFELMDAVTLPVQLQSFGVD